jgi:spore germination protein YaaH
MLLALLLALGPHAEDAALHASDPEAAWVRAPAAPVRMAQTAPALSKRVYGYLPTWVSIDLASFRWDLVSDIIAFSANIAADGTVTNPHSLPGGALIEAAHAHGLKVHLCATLFNTSGGNEVSTFLASPSAQAKAVSQLASLSKGIDGINLDFEFVSSSGRDKFTAFVQQFHAALSGPELTLAMPASIGYSGYDVPKLAAATERLLLMEYDYHWRAAPTAGANSPLDSVSHSVNGFLLQAPAASIAMGVPYYGYEWPTATASAGSSTAAAGTAVLFHSAFAKYAAYGRLWDSASSTPWYTYAASGQQHQGWVDDGQSLALKFQLVNSKALAGVMIWALGYDSGRGESWDAINAAFGTTGGTDAGVPEPQADGGQPIPGMASHGCSHAGLAPWWLLAILAAVRPATRRR